MKLKKILQVSTLSLFFYLMLGALVHHLVLPVTNVPADVFPKVGDKIVNRFAKESFVILKTGNETNGDYAEVELHLEPGGAIPASHIHPHYEETFKVSKGGLTVVIDGIEHEVGPGQSITVPRGVAHQPFNQKNVEFVGIVRADPPANWLLFISQFHGFLTENKEPRSNFDFFMQAMLTTDHYEDTYLSSPPIPVQKVLSFLLAPTARLLGHKSWKAEISKKWRSKENLDQEI